MRTYIDIQGRIPVLLPYVSKTSNFIQRLSIIEYMYENIG